MTPEQRTRWNEKVLRVIELEKQLAVAVAALKPFAAAGEFAMKGLTTNPGAYVHAEEYRRAAEALKQIGESDGK